MTRLPASRTLQTNESSVETVPPTALKPAFGRRGGWRGLTPTTVPSAMTSTSDSPLSVDPLSGSKKGLVQRVPDRDRSTCELGWFFGLALGATAILHGSIALLGLRFSVSSPSPSLFLYLLGLAAPTAAALVLSGPEGRSRFLRRVLRPRATAGTYVAAVLAQACVLATAWALLRATGEHDLLQFSLSSALPLLALGQVWVALGEEIGWRGFALPRLEQVLSPRMATLVLAFAWGVWHAPMFLVAGSLQAREPFWLFACAIFAWSCIHTALYHHARPSVVPNLAFHGCANLVLNLVVVPARAHGELATAYALAGAATWLLLGTHAARKAAA